MGVKLSLLSWWTPKFVISRELDNVEALTIQALKETLRIHAPNTSIKAPSKECSKVLTKKELLWQNAHNVLVDALAEALGREAAVKVAREALFKVGLQLGNQNRSKLGVGDSQGDLVKAAKIMYNILGISFNVEWLGPKHAILTVDRCTLAQNYSELTCEVLSATDEGVVQGLNPNMSMKFEKRITCGCKVCTAKIERRN